MKFKSSFHKKKTSIYFFFIFSLRGNHYFQTILLTKNQTAVNHSQPLFIVEPLALTFDLTTIKPQEHRPQNPLVNYYRIRYIQDTQNEDCFRRRKTNQQKKISISTVKSVKNKCRFQSKAVYSKLVSLKRRGNVDILVVHFDVSQALQTNFTILYFFLKIFLGGK